MTQTNPYPHQLAVWRLIDTPFGECEVNLHANELIVLVGGTREVPACLIVSTNITHAKPLAEGKGKFMVNGRDYNSRVGGETFKIYREDNGIIGIDIDENSHFSTAAGRSVHLWFAENFDVLVTPRLLAEARFKAAVVHARQVWDIVEKTKAYLAEVTTELKEAEAEYVAAGAALDRLDQQ